jgi:hypothetical protein
MRDIRVAKLCLNICVGESGDRLQKASKVNIAQRPFAGGRAAAAAWARGVEGVRHRITPRPSAGGAAAFAAGRSRDSGSRGCLSQVLEQLTGQTPKYGKARYTVRTFSIRRNEKIATWVTVRGEKAMQLLVSGRAGAGCRRPSAVQLCVSLAGRRRRCVCEGTAPCKNALANVPLPPLASLPGRRPR